MGAKQEFDWEKENERLSHSLSMANSQMKEDAEKAGEYLRTIKQLEEDIDLKTTELIEKDVEVDHLNNIIQSTIQNLAILTPPSLWNNAMSTIDKSVFIKPEGDDDS